MRTRKNNTPSIFDADGAAYFDREALEEADYAGRAYKSREAVVFLTPAEFLGLARSGTDTQKERTVLNVLAQGHKFNSVPFLRFAYGEGSTQAVVTGHEGRHRARALQALGVRQIPVVLKGIIRWDQQSDPSAWDYEAVLPQTLAGEEDHKKNVYPMPIPIHHPEVSARIRHNPVRTRRNSSDEPRVGDQWSWAGNTREIVAIEERDGERRIGVRESESPRVIYIYSAEEFPAYKQKQIEQNAAWEARRPEREREQRERAEREAREAARREEAEAAERSLVARLRAFATSERLTEKQKEKMKVDFRSLVSHRGKTYTIAGLIEEKIKVDGWSVDEDGIDGPGGAFIAKKSLTALGLRYAQYLWHREHPPAPEPPITARERELMNELFGVAKPKRRNPRFSAEQINALPVDTILILEADNFVGIDGAWLRTGASKTAWARLVPNGDHWRLSTDVPRPLVEFQRIMRHAEQGRRFSVETGTVLR
jgi:hypothetical protein